ncbi:hypothetical protein [Bradyrhizobium sp. STM 3557]|uniref:hypothetical protein n=1 Tax=Bradyrhizobium sp. STM 3557 TaxID=578920 RepID=UPI003890860A
MHVQQPAAPFKSSDGQIFGDLDDFREYAEIEAFMLARGWIDWHRAIDTCEWIRERWGISDVDAAQAVMADVFGPLRPQPEIDPDDIPLVPESPRRAYQTPRSTLDAFWYVVRTESTDGIADWLARHPRDAVHLHKLWKAKECSTAAA